MRDEADWPEAVEALNGGGSGDVLLLCEHASAHIPAEYSGLGLPSHELSRHIAWDIGAAALTRALSRRLDAAAFLGTCSRLLIDLNRPTDVPAAIPVRCEATEIPGNRGLHPGERARRIERIFTPYHATVVAWLADRGAAARPAALLAIHSFTPVFLGNTRRWHAGILYADAVRFGQSFAHQLSRNAALVIGENEPYVIARDDDYGVLVHGDDRGIPALLIEIRNDQLASDDDVERWADRLAGALAACRAEGVIGDRRAA